MELAPRCPVASRGGTCWVRYVITLFYRGFQIQSFDELVREEENKIVKSPGIKLGWIKGVLVPCLLSIWGVMLFLRMPWILGQAGIRDSILIILISLAIILITTFSLSAVSTNGKVQGGNLLLLSFWNLLQLLLRFMLFKRNLKRLI